jgi:hypothetical protein
MVCRAAKPEEEGERKLSAAPLAAMVAAGLIATSAVAPEEALAARSGGRAGSSAGFASRRAAAPRAAPSAA